MSKELRLKRIRERLELKLPVRVHCRETPDFEWTEITRLIDVTPFGAGFTLKRPVDKGRLLHMTIPMPRQLRVFDHVEDQYKVWALVRYLRTLSAQNDTSPIFEIGVAFVGKRAPRSYDGDPSRRYEIAELVSDTLTVEDILGPLPPSTDREYTRHNIPVELVVETLDEKGGVALSENTVTENISARGATIFTTFVLPIGRIIRVTSQQYNLTVFAVVRACSTGADGILRIHVEFVDKEFPL